MKQFFGGLAVGALVVGGAAYWLITRMEAEPIRFPPSSFLAGDDYVNIRGAVTGTQNDRIGYPNNFISVSCWRDQGACDVIDIHQYEPNAVSEPTLERWRIASWTPEQILLHSREPGQTCYRVILTINRPNRRVEYLREPQTNLARDERCRSMEMRLSRWTISEGVYWREYPPETGLGVPANAQGMN